MVALENNNGGMPYVYWTKQNQCVANTDVIYAIFSMWEENKCFLSTLRLIYQLPYPSLECRLWSRIHFVPKCKRAQIFALEKGFNLTFILRILLVHFTITEQKWEFVYSVMDVK